ncbi:hypothetical protein B7R77_21430 [Ralstonia solanacearum K60]|uniref:Uncharacterized protein n=1 Tax=Ralstonia solanacearum K60 TaxID=1091042 RepID=A0AAP8D2J9_RALSL|nr:hypothetical protein B7R77_21430 [Ralstonia solanacearum K60]
MCPAVRLSLHLPPPQIARVNADSLWLATPSHASNQPSTLCPQGFADLCITRWLLPSSYTHLAAPLKNQ